MVRTFIFDDGQTWHMELTRLTHQQRETVSLSAKFWTAAAPEQRVIGRLSPRALALSDAQLAEALRHALHSLTRTVELDA